MKLYSARAATEVALEAVQLFGGNGYMSEFQVEQLARDAKVLQIYAGTDEIQITHIAKDLLRPLSPGCAGPGARRPARQWRSSRPVARQSAVIRPSRGNDGRMRSPLPRESVYRDCLGKWSRRAESVTGP